MRNIPYLRVLFGYRPWVQWIVFDNGDTMLLQVYWLRCREVKKSYQIGERWWDGRTITATSWTPFTPSLKDQLGAYTVNR